MKHVFVAPGIGQGHIQPHLALAQALRERGHRVTVYAERAAAKPARLSGCGFVEMPVGDALERMHRATTTEQFTRMCADLAARVAPHLLRHLRQSRADAVVTDPLHLGSGLAAERSGLTWATLATTPSAVSRNARNFAQAKISTRSLRRQLGLPPTSADSLDQGISPSLYLLPWTSEFDQGRPPRQAVHVGPLSWSAPAKAAPRWVRELSDERPIVLVGVSTVPFKGLQEYVDLYVSEAIAALNALPVQGIITLIEAEYTIRCAPEPHVRVETFVPHSLLMPRLSALVTHGGWGTVGRALGAGVPLMVVPFALDQPLVGKLVERAGVGFQIPVHRITADRLHDRLTQLLRKGSPQRRSARALSRKLQRLDSGDLAAERVLRLLG